MSSIKKLNQLFEKTYLLMEEIMENPEHTDNIANGDYEHLPQAIEFFTSEIRVEDDWARDDEDGDNEDAYFVAGYHESCRVFYPFSETDKPDADEVEYQANKWLNLLESVILDLEDEEEFQEEATNIKTELSTLILNI